MKNMPVQAIKKELRKYASAKRKKTNEWFFKTGKGEYGEGDKFIGVRVPDTRKVAQKFTSADDKTVEKILHSNIHEERLLALLILVIQFKNADNTRKEKIYKFYLKNTKWINNWDLVDLSAYSIVGKFALSHPKEKAALKKLAVSKNMWERRIAIIATWAFIRENDFGETLKISKILLSDNEDLTHKAIGWMLREVWKRDAKTGEKFLMENYKKLPRTTLRYAIEWMEERKRKKFLKGEF